MQSSCRRGIQIFGIHLSKEYNMKLRIFLFWDLQLSHIHALFFPSSKKFFPETENVFIVRKQILRDVLTNSLEQFIREVGGIGSSHCSVGPSIFCLLPNCMGVNFVSVKNNLNIRIMLTKFCMELFSFVTLPAMTWTVITK